MTEKRTCISKKVDIDKIWEQACLKLTDLGNVADFGDIRKYNIAAKKFDKFLSYAEETGVYVGEIREEFRAYDIKIEGSLV
jgi:hypothetical protein